MKLSLSPDPNSKDCILLKVENPPGFPTDFYWNKFPFWDAQQWDFCINFLAEHGISGEIVEINSVQGEGAYFSIRRVDGDGDIGGNSRDVLLSVKENYDRNLPRH